MKYFNYDRVTQANIWAILKSLIDLPKKFWMNFFLHVAVLIPLLATLLIQKLQDLVDDRYMGLLGSIALMIQSIQSNFFLIGQEVGLATATSLLVFWRRREVAGKQGSVFILHLILSALAAGVGAFLIGLKIPNLCKYFNIPVEYYGIAALSFRFGLFNLVLRSLYVPINALLVASDDREQKKISLFYSTGIVLAKALLAWLILSQVKTPIQKAEDLELPLMIYGIGSNIILGSVVIILGLFVLRRLKGGSPFSWSLILKVWPCEIGIGAVSAASPVVFGVLIARSEASSALYLTYQLALHLTYMVTLPVLAGIQIAIRDASAEQSQTPWIRFRPLHETRWWPNFFYASLVPTLILLAIVLVFAQSVFRWIYRYEIPPHHREFVVVFYLAWMFWQCGTIFLIQLRASQNSARATLNFVIAGLGVQVGTTLMLLKFGLGSPFFLALAILAYSMAYLALNWQAVSQIQAKYYQLLEKLRGKRKYWRLIGVGTEVKVKR